MREEDGLGAEAAQARGLRPPSLQSDRPRFKPWLPDCVRPAVTNCINLTQFLCKVRITAEINFIRFLGGENAHDHRPACLAHNTFYPSVTQGYQYAICKKVLNDGKIIL